MSRFIRLSRSVALIIAISLLGACSAVKLAYNQAPDVTYWWLDGYFDVNEQQTPKLRDELSRLFAWHRASELPKTADLLAQAAQRMAGEISADQACRVVDQGRRLIDNVISQAMPALADLAPTITPAQIEHLKRKYAKNTDAFERDFMQGSAQSRQAKRLTQAINRSEMLYGKLQEPQIAVIQQMVASSPFDAATSLKERQRRQQEMILMLTQLSAAQASPANAAKALREYVQRTWESPEPTYRAYALRMTQQACQSFASVHASTTPAQRANAVKVLKGYETDLRALAAQR